MAWIAYLLKGSSLQAGKEAVGVDLVAEMHHHVVWVGRRRPLRRTHRQHKLIIGVVEVPVARYGKHAGGVAPSGTERNPCAKIFRMSGSGYAASECF